MIRKLRDFERNDIRHLKRTIAARLGDESSTKVRKAFSALRQSLSQI
jgi:1,4-dihydroxy-2-naphthoate octaprenyltransferase